MRLLDDERILNKRANQLISADDMPVSWGPTLEDLQNLGKELNCPKIFPDETYRDLEKAIQEQFIDPLEAMQQEDDEMRNNNTLVDMLTAAKEKFDSLEKMTSTEQEVQSAFDELMSKVSESPRTFQIMDELRSTADDNLILYRKKLKDINVAVTALSKCEATIDQLAIIQEAFDLSVNATPNLSHPADMLLQVWIKENRPENPLAVITLNDHEYRNRNWSVVPSAFLDMSVSIDLEYYPDSLYELRRYPVPPSSEYIEKAYTQADITQLKYLNPGIGFMFDHRNYGVEKYSNGRVPLEIKIFWEVIMALKPKQTEAKVVMTLGELKRRVFLGYIREDGTINHDKFVRRIQMPRLIAALRRLRDDAFIVCMDENRDLFRCQMITWMGEIHYDSDDGTPITFYVEEPPDTKTGGLLDKRLHREFADRTNGIAVLQMYHGVVNLWDKCKQQAGGHLLGLIPDLDPLRAHDDCLLNPKDNSRILDQYGEMVLNPLSKEAFNYMDKKWNPDRGDVYPILEPEIIRLLAFPRTASKQMAISNYRKTRKILTWMHDQNYLIVEWIGRKARIMPSYEHIQGHKAIIEANKKAQARARKAKRDAKKLNAAR